MQVASLAANQGHAPATANDGARGALHALPCRASQRSRPCPLPCSLRCYFITRTHHIQPLCRDIML